MKITEIAITFDIMPKRLIEYYKRFDNFEMNKMNSIHILERWKSYQLNSLSIKYEEKKRCKSIRNDLYKRFKIYGKIQHIPICRHSHEVATLTRIEQSEIYDTLHMYAYVHTYVNVYQAHKTTGLRFDVLYRSRMGEWVCGLFVVATSTKVGKYVQNTGHYFSICDFKALSCSSTNKIFTQTVRMCVPVHSLNRSTWLSQHICKRNHLHIKLNDHFDCIPLLVQLQHSDYYWLENVYALFVVVFPTFPLQLSDRIVKHSICSI